MQNTLGKTPNGNKFLRLNSNQSLESNQPGKFQQLEELQFQIPKEKLRNKKWVRYQIVNYLTQKNVIYAFIIILIVIAILIVLPQIIIPDQGTYQLKPKKGEPSDVMFAMTFKNYSTSQKYGNYRKQYQKIIETSEKSLQMLHKLKQIKQHANLESNYNQQYRENQFQEKQVTIIIITSPERKNFLFQTLISFYTQNTYLKFKIKIVVDGESKKEDYKQLGSEFKNITWAYTEGKTGQKSTLDFAHKDIDTQYVLLSEDNCIYKKEGFIQFALKKLQNSKQNISKVLLRKLNDIGEEKLSIFITNLAGFSFNTGMYKLEDYQLIQGGYSQLTRNASYGKMAGQIPQLLISKFYFQKQYTMIAPYQPFYQYIEQSQWVLPIFNIQSKLLSKKADKVKAQEKLFYELGQSVKDFESLRNSLKSKSLSKIVTAIFVQSSTRYEKYGDFQLIDLGANFDRQLGSELDLFKIQETKVYKQLIKQNIEANYSSIKLINIEPPTSKPKPVKLSNEFKNKQQIKKYIQANYPNQNNKQLIPLKLLNDLEKQQNNNKLQQIQYYLIDQHYKTNDMTKKLGLCIFVYGQGLFNESKYKNLLKSIEKQNYTNYKVIVVDQQTQNAEKIKQWRQIKQEFPSLGTRIKITEKTNSRLKRTGNTYLMAKSLCANQEIVVQIGPNSRFIGRQNFNTINAIFQNQQTWVALFQNHQNAQSTQIRLNQTGALRVEDNRQTLIPLVKAYRYFLNRKVPIQHIIELQYTQKFGSNQDFLIPKFYKGNIELFHLYSYMQMSGPNRTVIISDPIHIYEAYINKPGQDCQQMMQQYTITKAKAKTPLAVLETKQSYVRYVKNYTIPSEVLSKMKQKYQAYRKCKPFVFDRLKKMPSVPSTSLTISNAKLFLAKRSAKFYKPLPFQNLNTVQMSELPFCLFVSLQDNNNTQYQQKLIRSIFKQNYQNYLTIFLGHSIPYQKIQQIQKQQNTLHNITVDRIYFQINSTKVKTYSDYQYLMHKLCVQNSLVMFVNDLLKMNTLQTLSNYHQTTPTYVLYSQKFEFVELYSFYMRVFDLIQIYDNGANKKCLETHDFSKLQHFLCLAIMQIATKRIGKLFYEDIHEMEPQMIDSQDQQKQLQKPQKRQNLPILTIQPGSQLSKTTLYMKITRDEGPMHQFMHTPYEAVPSLKLTPQQSIDIASYDKSVIELSKMNTSIQIFQLTSSNMQRALQYQQIYYLPKQHVLDSLQYRSTYGMYGFYKYELNQTIQINMDVCLTFIAKKHTSRNRLINNLRLALKQNYTYFHIVYIDNDCNEDISQSAITQLKSSGLNQSKITYIKNTKQQPYLYNTLNAAYNFCQQKQYQIVLDSDQQLIGYHYFNVINWVYTNSPELWLIYTNFKTDRLNFGTAFRVINMYQYRGYDGRVAVDAFMPRVAAWSIHLIKSIPKQYLEYQGKWLEQLEDVALMHSLMELATPPHADYIALPFYEELEKNNQTQGLKLKEEAKNGKQSEIHKIHQHILSHEVLQNVYPINERSKQNLNIGKLIKKDQRIQWKIQQIFKLSNK